MNSSYQVLHVESFPSDLEETWKWNTTKMKAVVISLFLSIFTLTILFKLTQKTKDDKLLGGLLLDGLDEIKCESRYQLHLYGRTRSQSHRLSPYLISRLRKYEQLHKQCGPNTYNYNKTVENLKSASGGGRNDSSSACKYVIYTPVEGLGNRMITLGASFLYALLTNRVLVIGNGGDMEDLFCEPFPEVSWMLPSDFPIGKVSSYSVHSYGKLQRNGNSSEMVYFDLGYTGHESDKLFFCDHDQMLLQHVPWVMITSQLYFLPSLFLVPSFQEELHNLFPEKETVFHHLGRYLFHPSNSVWGLITRYYDAYLAKADEILGIQIRVYQPHFFRKAPSLDDVLACAINENLLPDLNATQPIIKPSNYKPHTKAVLVVSLSANHSDEIRKMYWEYAAKTGEEIAVYQPSHDEYQQSQDLVHDSKALAEIYLLSLSDKLVISGQSTFGYTAQSLGGLRPWILYGVLTRTKSPNPPCGKALSMEPCEHYPSEYYTCQNATRIKTANHLPHVRRCEDIYSGVKLID